MNRFADRFKYNGLFIKIFIIMVVSMIAVSVLTTWTTIRISERLFINTFSIMNAKVINQIKSGFESFNYSVVAAANAVQQNGAIKQFLTEKDTEALGMAKAYYSMNKQMKQISSIVNAYDVNIAVSGMNGRTFATSRSNWPVTDEDLRKHPLAVNALRQPKRLLYQFDHGAGGIAAAAGEPTIVATKALMERSTGNVYGTLFFTMRESEFRRFYASYTSGGNDVVILNRSGVIVSSNDESYIGRRDETLLEQVQEMEEKALDYKDGRILGANRLMLTDYLSVYDMYIVNLIDKKSLLTQLTDTKAIVLICIGIVGGALIIVFLITRRLTKSLTRLVKQISTISKYEFDHYVTVSGSYETRQLAQAFNAMLDELQEYVRELVQTQKKQRNAELEALQRQINPHFLYNTLASVKFMVQRGSREKAAETIHALISLLQNAIGNVSETVTVEQELDNLKHYVLINQVRNGDRIKVDYFVSPDCLQALVPKLMIQPFIENAFFHAFHRKPEGYVYVMISREGGTLTCEVADNGDGMNGDGSGTSIGNGGPSGSLPNSKSKRQLFTGIGVRNVHERLQLLYGEPHGVTIASVPGEGTVVKMRLPYQESKESPSA